MLLIEKVIIAAIVALLILIAVFTKSNQDRFNEACVATGGTSVYDGRQWQCFKRQ